MTQKKIWDWVRANKLLTALITFFSLIILMFLLMVGSSLYYSMGGSFMSPGYDSYYAMESYDSMASPMAISSPLSFPSKGGGYYDSYSDYSPATTSRELEVKQGRITAKSRDVEEDLALLQEMTLERDGYIESSSKAKSRTFITVYAQARVPIESFEEYIDAVKEKFDVESFEVSDYRIDVQRQLDELDVIMMAMEDYNKLREDALRVESGEERVRILSSIVSEMQDLARRKKELERDLGGSQRQSDLSTVNFSFREDVKIKLWPENLGDRLRERVNWAVDTVVTTVMFFLANAIVLFVRVLEYIAYILIIALPVIFTWKAAQKIKKKKA